MYSVIAWLGLRWWQESVVFPEVQAIFCTQEREKNIASVPISFSAPMLFIPGFLYFTSLSNLQNTWARYSTLNLFILTEDSFQELTNKRTLFIYYFHVIKSKLDCMKLCIQLYYNHHSPVCVYLCGIRGTAFREVISRQEHDPLCFTPRLIL